MEVMWFVLVSCLFFNIAMNPGVSCEKDVNEKLRKQGILLARQIMMQQVFNEEHIRSSGNSGVKIKRQRNEGTKPYYEDSYTGLSIITVHDHANHRHTVGLGEFVAVLNGVEFRTRHNDYGLYQPSTKSNAYHETEPIELPDVPPGVLAKTTVQEQIQEMRLWFKAFRDGERSLRDYRKYFKPVLCYLEGAWTLTDPENSIEEPFMSDRHFLMAQDWNELHRRIRFTSYSGSKNNGENIAFLPTTIIDMVNDTEPVFAQWNYRIMCHPLRRWIDPSTFRVVDDMAVRMGFRRTLKSHKQSRSARFQLNPVNHKDFIDGHTYFTELDRIMSEVPGKDNYNKFLKDDVFGLRSRSYQDVNSNLNAARYHRWYQVPVKGANGRQHLHRAFSDTNVFMAMNTRPEIAEQTAYDECTRDTHSSKKVCAKTYKQRWSYAIPLEILYLTPLGKWNPFNIPYTEGKLEHEDARNGGFTKKTAFKEAGSTLFYLTPSEFFKGTVKDSDAADTSGAAIGLLNTTGHVCSVMASGVYVKMPEIEGVGEIRTRYPIAPVHQEGEAAWKELQALKDLMLLQDQKFEKLREEVGLAGGFHTMNH